MHDMDEATVWNRPAAALFFISESCKKVQISEKVKTWLNRPLRAKYKILQIQTS